MLDGIPGIQGGPRMHTSTTAGAASLAEFVRATESAELDDGDAERLATILANTRKAFAAYADYSRFDAEPAEIAPALRRLAPAAASPGGGEDSAGNSGGGAS